MLASILGIENLRQPVLLPPKIALAVALPGVFFDNWYVACKLLQLDNT